ncbi:PQQ-dependent sugar dehydrogenase [Streptosporangium lutulentum]
MVLNATYTSPTAPVAYTAALGQTGLAAHAGHAGHAATSAAAAAAAVIPPADYQQVQLAVGGAKLGEAMSLAVLPNRSVVHTARDGTVRITTAAGVTKVAGKLNVYTHDEEGLQGVAADPNFATNRHVYLYYSPGCPLPTGTPPPAAPRPPSTPGKAT